MMLWLFVVATVLLFAGIFLCDIFPPPNPGDGPQEWATFWTSNHELKRLGLVCGLAGGACFGCLPVLLFLQLKRIDGPSSPLAYFSLGLGVISTIPAAILPWIFWSPLVFRDTLNPELAQGLSDMGFFTFFLPWPFIVWMLGMAICVLRSPAQAVIPRWWAYLSIWIALSFLPAATIYFFKDGPLAWNGLLPWWLGIVTVSIWLVATFVVLVGAVAHLKREEEAPSPQHDSRDEGTTGLLGQLAR
jgi:hypothetical protein